MRSRQDRSSPGVKGFGNVCKEKATLKLSYDSLCFGGFSSAPLAFPILERELKIIPSSRL